MGRPAYPTAEDLAARLASAGFTVNASAELGIAAKAGRLEFERRTQRVMLAGTSETRYYDPPVGASDLVEIHDVVGAVAVGYQPVGSTLTPWTLNTEYRLEPRNAPALGKPYQYLKLRYGGYGSPLSPDYAGSIQVTGTFGYGTTLNEDVWTAMCLLGCSSVVQDARMNQTGGVLGWKEGPHSEDYGELTHKALTDAWEAQVNRIVNLYRKVRL